MSSSQYMRMRMPDDSRVSADPLAKSLYDRRPGKPAFNKLTPLSTQPGAPIRVIQQGKNRIGQRVGIVRPDKLHTAVSGKCRYDARDRARDDRTMTGQIVEEFNRRSFSSIPAERCNTHAHRTDPSRHLPVRDSTNPRSTAVESHPLGLLLQFFSCFPVPHQEKLSRWTDPFDRHHRIEQTRQSLISVEASDEPNVRTIQQKPQF